MLSATSGLTLPRLFNALSTVPLDTPAFSAISLSRFLVVEPDADFIFLHTHTWAYKAVGMYQKMGFRITKKALPTSRTDFSCMDVLKDVLPNSIIAQLLEKD